MIKDDNIYLEHILESIKEIEEFSKDATKESLSKDRLRQNAIIRELEVIGEAAKNISSSFRDKHKKAEWKKIAGLRDKLIHHYFGVDLNIVWDVIKSDIPELKKDIEEIISKK